VDTDPIPAIGIGVPSAVITEMDDLEFKDKKDL
jgi:hypothetical protein